VTVLYGVFGAGGCGRGLLPILRDEIAGLENTELVFVDDALVGDVINGQRVLSFSDFCQHTAQTKLVSIAIANPNIRLKIVELCSSSGVGFYSIRARNVVVMDDVAIGEGAMLSPFVTLTSNIKIGRHFHANIYSYVEHDCEIGDFVTFAPGAKCNGNVIIEDGAYIGSGAVIRQGKPDKKLRIGKNAIVGMGAIVLSDVAPGATVVGNPARVVHHPGGPR
jgi:sugar O-acyltransferase (sialic acid O-acetyltransferase NeuD family)